MAGSAIDPDPEEQDYPRGWGRATRLPARILVLAAGYAMLGWIGQQLAPPPGFASLIWPASGLAIAAITVWGPRTWPGVFLGALTVNAFAAGAATFPPDGTALFNATVIATGSTLQALLAAFWIRRLAGFPLKLRGPFDAFRLILVLGPLTCIIGASFGTATLYGTGVLPRSNLIDFWLRWWAGDMGGILILLPLLLLAPWCRDKIWWRGESVPPFSLWGFVAILVLLGATLSGWRLNMQSAYERHQTSFELLATDNKHALEYRMQSYRQALDGGAALFEASDEVTLDDWRIYTSALNLKQALPGISGIGFIEAVKAGDEAALVAGAKARGWKDFQIHPLTQRNERFVIVAIEPREDNRAAVGLDIAFEQNRRQAARQARDTGRPIITRRILLVQDDTKSPGFLLLRPIYRTAMPLRNVEERRAAFRGWVYAPFIAPRFMAGLTASQGELFDVAVYDGSRPDPEQLIFSSTDLARTESESSSAFMIERTFKVMGQPWTVVWTSTPAFERGAVTREADLLLAGGLLITLMFAFLLLAAARREAYVSGQVEERTRELEETVEALAASERRFGDLAGLSPAGIFRTDPYGFCNYVNESWLCSTGLTPSEALGAGWLNAVHPDARKRVRDEWLAAVGRADQLRMEVQFAKGDGISTWVDLIAAPQRDPNGEMQGFIGVAIDITEQKRVVDALSESEQRFHSLTSFSPAGILRTSPEGKFTYVNPAWCRMAGLSENEAMGLGWREAVHPLDVDRLTADWFAAVESGAAYRGEFRWLHEDGSIVWVDALAKPEWSDDHTLRGYIGVVLDITERKRFEREIAERDQELSILAQNAIDAVFRIGLDGLCIYASPSTKDVLGVSVEHLIGKPLLERLHPEDEEAAHTVFNCLLSGKTEREVITYRSKAPDKAGGYRWLEANVGLVRDCETGAPKEISASVRDISDRKQLELDLVAARKTAENAAAAKATFLANMSHEIRTPMNGVIGFAELLLEDEIAPEQREKAKLIADSGRTMMRILNDILDISKIDAGRMTIVREPIDLRLKLSSCMNLMDPSARQKGLKLDLQIDEEVPPRIMGDPLRLRQILSNLIGNAVKFTSEGSVRGRAWVERVPGSHDMLCIAVEDTGIGIPENRLEAIFHEFSQADDSTARTFGGTGLGLTISNELAKLMGGEMLVSSEEGEGSVFTLRIPLVLPQEGEVDAMVASPSEEEPRYVRLPRILVAEDHDINQALILSIGSRLGLALSIAANGEEAVRMVKEAAAAGEAYDMVLMDIQMPVMDGLRATHLLRESGITAEQLPILAQTANAYSEDVQNCLAAGMQDHLAKPIRLRDLKEAIQTWLPRDLIENAPELETRKSMQASEAALMKRYAERRETTLQALHRLDTASPLDPDEVQAVTEMLHKLAGSAGMFGEPELGEIARAHDKAMTGAEREALSEAVRRAQQAFSKWK